MDSMLRRSYEVESKKYGVHGVIKDYGVLIELIFSYQGKKIVLPLERPYPMGDFAMLDLGEATIDSYVENLREEDPGARKLMLHYWYVEKRRDPDTDQEYLLARGIVTGHNKLSDATSIHTSAVEEIFIDKDLEEARIRTRNSIYHCPLEYCRWRKQDKAPELLPDYDWVKENYQGRRQDPSIEEDKVLLVLSNFDEYYFHSLYYKPAGEAEPLDCCGDAHVGMFQDSFLIRTEDHRIDLRYFPHYKNIEFYTEDTEGKPFFIENIGDVTLFAQTFKGLLKLAPGERKQVIKENAEAEEPVLPGGDLYPAQIVGEVTPVPLTNVDSAPLTEENTGEENG